MRRTPVVLALAALAALVLSCSDATSPGASVRVYVTMTSFGGPSFDYGSNGLEVSCEPRLQAIVTGKMGGSWVGGTVLWYVGTNRAKPTDSTVFTKSDMDAAWGSRLVPGDTLVSDWWFANTLPFRADFVLRYKGPSGPVRSETVGFTCGPAIDSSTPAPTVDTPTLVSAPAGDLSPGDTILVRLVAHAPAGLWQTSLRLTGACADTEFFSERLATTNSHTAQFVLSPKCALGQQLDVIGGALDGAGRVAWTTLSTGRTLADRRPPIVEPIVENKRAGLTLFAGSIARSEFFVGDSMILHLQAEDNFKLARIYWEETTSGRRDSIAADGVLSSARAAVYVAPGMSPTPRLRFWARDAAGLTSDTLATPAGEMTVSPRVAPTAVSTATIDGDVVDAVYDAKRQLVYFAERNAGRIAVFSPASMSVVSTITVDTPVSVDLVPSGDSLVVSLLMQRALAVVDLTTATPAVTTIKLTGIDSAAQAPYAAQAMANGKVLVALGSVGSAPATLLTLDLSTGAQRMRSEVTTPSAGALTVTRTADASIAIVGGACLRRYSAATDTFAGCANATGGQRLAVDADASVISNGLTMFDGTPGLVRVLPSWGTWPGGVDGTALTADGATLLVGDPALGIVRVGVGDGVPIDAVGIPFAPRRVMLAGGDKSVVAWTTTGTSTSVAAVELT